MDEVLSTMKQEGLFCHQDIQKSEACFIWHILLWQKIALKKKKSLGKKGEMTTLME